MHKFHQELIHQILKRLKKFLIDQMLLFSKNLEFEKAAAARDALFRLREQVFGAAQHDGSGEHPDRGAEQ